MVRVFVHDLREQIIILLTDMNCAMHYCDRNGKERILSCEVSRKHKKASHPDVNFDESLKIREKHKEAW